MSSLLPKPEEVHAAVVRAGDRAFEAHLNSPMTKVLISLVPASEPPEVFMTLLRSFFDLGLSVGTGASLLEITKAFHAVAQEVKRRGEGDAS
jgi:hypothetical protein